MIDIDDKVLMCVKLGFVMNVGIKLVAEVVIVASVTDVVIMVVVSCDKVLLDVEVGFVVIVRIKLAAEEVIVAFVTDVAVMVVKSCDTSTEVCGICIMGVVNSVDIADNVVDRVKILDDDEKVLLVVSI